MCSRSGESQLWERLAEAQEWGDGCWRRRGTRKVVQPGGLVQVPALAWAAGGDGDKEPGGWSRQVCGSVRGVGVRSRPFFPGWAPPHASGNSSCQVILLSSVGVELSVSGKTDYTPGSVSPKMNLPGGGEWGWTRLRGGQREPLPDPVPSRTALVSLGGARKSCPADPASLHSRRGQSSSIMLSGSGFFLL